MSERVSMEHAVRYTGMPPISIRLWVQLGELPRAFTQRDLDAAMLRAAHRRARLRRSRHGR